jgi:hypothetical protein
MIAECIEAAVGIGYGGMGFAWFIKQISRQSYAVTKRKEEGDTRSAEVQAADTAWKAYREIERQTLAAVKKEWQTGFYVDQYYAKAMSAYRRPNVVEPVTDILEIEYKRTALRSLVWPVALPVSLAVKGGANVARAEIKQAANERESLKILEAKCGDDPMVVQAINTYKESKGLLEL